MYGLLIYVAGGCLTMFWLVYLSREMNDQRQYLPILILVALFWPITLFVLLLVRTYGFSSGMVSKLRQEDEDEGRG